MLRRKIAIIGARGIANYGGFETFVAELAPRLRQRGFEVVCSHRMKEGAPSTEDYRGVTIMYFPFRFPRSSKVGRLFEVLYDWYFALKCAFVLKCDVVYCLGVVSGIILFILRLSNASTMVNLDGIEWRRQKFRLIERSFVRLSFMASCLASNRLIIDNRRLAEYVAPRYAWKTVCVPYGVNPTECPDWRSTYSQWPASDILSTISPRSYWLVVARLEPDNSIHVIVDAFLRSKSEDPLVIVGGFSSSSYEERIRSLIARSEKEKAIIFTGPIFDQEVLGMLRCYCRAYIHGHSVGGTNPSLLEAMNAGNVVIAHDNVFNREVCQDCGLYFGSSDELLAILNDVGVDIGRYQPLGAKARLRARKDYRWEGVTERYVELLQGL